MKKENKEFSDLISSQATIIEELQARLKKVETELAWWHNLIRKHHDNKTCPNLKTYVENLERRLKEMTDRAGVEEISIVIRNTRLNKEGKMFIDIHKNNKNLAQAISKYIKEGRNEDR